MASGRAPLKGARPIQRQKTKSDGATAIRIALNAVIRAGALCLGLAWNGAYLLSATAQSFDEVDPNQQVSEAVVDVAGWVIASGDNRGLPFAVIDKDAAQVLIFDAEGKLQGLAPALIGSAVGDDSAPGVGDRELKDIPMKQRTTPAGRFLAGYGPAAGGERVLWVDYATAISIHPLPNSTPKNKKEKRKERLASPTAKDNRVTHGCINVSPAFYSKVVNPVFENGGIFYVLPDSTPLQTAFPSFEGVRNIVATSEGAVGAR